MPRVVDDVALVECPYCAQSVQLFVDPGTSGTYVEDCSRCCHPWNVTVVSSEDGDVVVNVERAG